MIKYLALLLFFILSSVSRADSQYYMNRSSPNLLPTGCQLGWGPQYQSFDGYLGYKIRVGDRDFFDFNPVNICQEAAKICLSQLSGQSCCTNACRQQNTGMGSKSKSVISVDGFNQCVRKCPGAPSFRSISEKLKRQMETPFSVRYINKRQN